MSRSSRLVLCLLAATLFHASFAGQPPTPDFVPGELLVKLAPGKHLDAPALDALENRFGPLAATPLFQKGSARSVLDQYLLITSKDPNFDVAAAVQALTDTPGVAWSGPNYLMHLSPATASTPPPISAQTQKTTGAGDPHRGEQWALDALRLPEAWALSRGDATQVIAIIDTGIDLDHPDLASKLWNNPAESSGDANDDGCPGRCGVDDDNDGLIDEDGQGRQPGDPGYDASFVADDDENGFIDDFHGWNFVGNGDGDSNNQPMDDNGHGTHVAGIAAAATDNGVGGAGACPDCAVMAVKAFQSNGTASFVDIARAIEYARRNGATVINMSFVSYADSQLLYDAASLAYSSAVLVAAAGNDNVSRQGFSCSEQPFPTYPASYPFVLGVEAANPGGSLAYFSNCQYELRYPGVNIFSTLLGDAYAAWSGTSMATPMVAGVAGLLRHHRREQPGWGPDLLFGTLVQAGADARTALELEPSPDLELASFSVVDETCPTCDDDGRPDAGESIALTVTLRNLWGNAGNVNGVLTTTDPLVTIDSGSTTWGSIGPNAFDDNADNPFLITINPNAGNNRAVSFQLTVTDAASGSVFNETLSITIQRGLERGGAMSADETWTPDNLYLITQNLRIDPGVTLTIQPGTRIQLMAGRSISVKGTMVARGTPEARVVFTGNPNGWDSILYTDEATAPLYDEDLNYLSGSAMEYCLIEGSTAILAAVEIRTPIYFAHNIIQNNVSNYPIQFEINNSSPPGILMVRNNLLVNNTTTSGVYMQLYYMYEGEFYFLNNTLASNLPRNTDQSRAVGFYPRALGHTISGNTFLNRDLYDLRMIGDIDYPLPGNYWGTTDTNVIDAQIFDFFEDSNRGMIMYQPILEQPDPDAPVVISRIDVNPVSPVSVGTVAFTIHFSRDMDQTANPEVFFGPDVPYTSHAVKDNGAWVDARTWRVETQITVFTGDGLQTITVAGARDLEGFTVPPRDHRFGFEIVTVGTSSTSLSAVGGPGQVALSWQSGSLEDEAGYHVFRSDQEAGPFTRLNSALVVDPAWTDHTAEPGVTYHYIYRVVNTQLEEGPDSNVASAAALDDIAPVLVHTAVASAPLGEAMTLTADITDNAVTPTAELAYRLIGETAYTVTTMTNAVGHQFTANIPAQAVAAPGLEYYLAASDGVNRTTSGTAEQPHRVEVLALPLITALEPNTGGFAGGDTVLITGEHFQSGAEVFFNGIAATSVTFLSSTQLRVTTPAHYPAVAGIRVLNPDQTTGFLQAGFTFLGNPTTLSPANLSADSGADIQITINTTGLTGFLSGVMTLNYDADVLNLTQVTRGTLTTSFLLSTHAPATGAMTAALAGTTPITGSGEMLVFHFTVVGQPGTSSDLTLSQVVLNDGAIPAGVTAGWVEVTQVFSIAGSVRYFNEARAVSGAVIQAESASVFEATTASGGAYLLSNLTPDHYTATPTKTGDLRDAVSAFDAALVLQAATGAVTLDANQRIAADVNGNGGVSSADAAEIQRLAVGMISSFPALPSDWVFSPTSRDYSPLAASQTNQDYTAILKGDVSGNWGVSSVRALGDSVSLSLPELTHDVDAAITIPLTMTMTSATVSAADLALTYDPTVMRLDGVTTSLEALVTYFETEPGRLRIAVSASSPLAEGGELLQLSATLIGKAGEASALHFESAVVDEGATLVTTLDGAVVIEGCSQMTVSHDRWVATCGGPGSILLSPTVRCAGPAPGYFWRVLEGDAVFAEPTDARGSLVIGDADHVVVQLDVSPTIGEVRSLVIDVYAFDSDFDGNGQVEGGDWGHLRSLWNQTGAPIAYQLPSRLTVADLVLAGACFNYGRE